MSSFLRVLGIVVIFASALVASATKNSAQITWYDPKAVMSKTGMGACGKILDRSMPIAAVSQSFFDRYPGKSIASNANPLCGKEINVSYRGKSVKVKVMDACASCNGSHDVDLSKSAFAKLADTSVGVLHGSWEFVNPQDNHVHRRSATHWLNIPERRLDNESSLEVTRDIAEISVKPENVIRDTGTRRMSRIMRRLVQGSRV